MRKILLSILVVVVLAPACSYANDPEDRRTSAAGFPLGRVLIDTEEGSVFVDVEIAETEAQRQKGLMNRDSLPGDAGMIFLFFEPTTGGFWMKDTEIPLSIAFIDDDYRIRQIIDMEPCPKEPCEIYQPSDAFSAALEVNQGAFEEWSVQPGDRITLTRKS